MRGILLALLLLLAGVPAAGAAVQPPTVHVQGNRLVGGDGRPLRLLGVDRGGFESSCLNGRVADGPVGAAAATAMAAWKINAVRLPLTATCWNGQPAYRSAVGAFVRRLHAAHLYVIIDLQYARATLTNLPDPRIARTFWTSVAHSFKDDPGVLFDLYNEPHHVSWSQWRDAMQSLVDAVRGAGSTAPIMVGGLEWANDLSHWLEYEPNDPAGQLVASFHVYNFTACNQRKCWDRTVAPVAQHVPVVTGEIGENDCAHRFIDQYMAWADEHAISYLGWVFSPWGCKNGPALVTSWTGGATPFGAGFRAHLLVLAASGHKVGRG